MPKCKNTKFYRLLLIIFLCLFILTGCWSSRPIEDLNIIIGSAIDRETDKTIKSTLQYVIPEAMEAKSGKNMKPYINVATVGFSLEPAGWETTLKREGYLFGPHQKTVVISEELAREIELRQITDLYYRDIDIRGSTLIFISKGRADKALETKEQNVIPAIRIAEIATEGLTTRILSKTTLLKVGGLMNSGSSFLIPILDSTKEAVQFNGAAVFQGKSNKMIGTLEKDEVEGINWITAQSKSGAVKAFKKMKDGPSYYQIEAIKTKITPHVKGDKISFDVKIDSEGRLSEYWNPKLKPAFNQKNLVIREKAAEKTVKLLVEKVTKKMQKEYKVDVAGFGNQLRIHNPKVWLKVKDNWDEKFSKVPIKYKVNLSIKDYGMIGRKKRK